MQRSALTLTMMLASLRSSDLRAKVNLDYRHEIKDFHRALLSSRPRLDDRVARVEQLSDTELNRTVTRKSDAETTALVSRLLTNGSR